MRNQARSSGDQGPEKRGDTSGDDLVGSESCEYGDEGFDSDALSPDPERNDDGGGVNCSSDSRGGSVDAKEAAESGGDAAFVAAGANSEGGLEVQTPGTTHTHFK